MKLSKILGAAALTGVLAAASAVSALAADYSYTIGKPINLTNNESVDIKDVKEGMMLAFPVDITSSTGSVQSFTFSADYDTDLLTPGVAKGSYSSVKNNVLALGAMVQDDNKTCVATIDAMLDDFDERAAAVSSSNYPGTQVIYTAAFTVKQAVNASAPEFYVLFTAKQDFSAETLNKSYFVLNGEESNINIDDNVSDHPDVEQPTANKCAGAFKIVIDKATLDTYIHQILLQVNGNSPVEVKTYNETTDSYEFPVRLTDNTKNATTANVTVVFINGTEAEPDASLTKTVNLTVDLTEVPTDYSTTTDFASATSAE